MKFTSIPDLKLESLGSTELVFIALAALAVFALIIKLFEIRKKRKRLKIENESSSAEQSGDLPEGADSLQEEPAEQTKSNEQEGFQENQPESDEFSEMEDLLSELDTTEQCQEESSSEEHQEKPQPDFQEIPSIEEDDVDGIFSPVESEEDDWNEMMDAMAKDDYGTDFSKEFLNEFKGVKQDAASIAESEETVNDTSEPEKSELEETVSVEVILHDQVSVEEQSELEDEQVVEEQHKQTTAVSLVDGSDRVMVSIGEKFEAKYKKSFEVELNDSAVVEKEFLDGFVFDGRIQFRVSFSEALAKHLTLKDVVEIANGKGSYAGYKVKLDVIDKCNFTCTRTFNYRKVRNAVLVVQLYFE